MSPVFSLSAAPETVPSAQKRSSGSTPETRPPGNGSNFSTGEET